MFTGIITEIGNIERVASVGGVKRILVRAPQSAPELAEHDSVSVDGVCLTVVETGAGTFSVEAVEETVKKTTAGSWKAGASVNLELALRVGDRLGGHLVQGHVDCVGTIRSIRELPGSRLVTVEFPARFSRYVIPVGSIAVNGISLTAASVSGSRFTVSVIPWTLEHTTLGEAVPGTSVNLEFDLIGKYVEKLFPGGSSGGGITDASLGEWGYGGPG